MSKIKIDNNIPMPEPRGKWASLAREMKAGNSVKVGNRKESVALINAIKRLGHSAMTKTTRKGKEITIRVWKGEKAESKTTSKKAAAKKK